MTLINLEVMTDFGKSKRRNIERNNIENATNINIYPIIKDFKCKEGVPN